MSAVRRVLAHRTLELSERQISVLIAALEQYDEDLDDQMHQEREQQRSASARNRERYSFVEHIEARQAESKDLRELLVSARHVRVD